MKVTNEQSFELDLASLSELMKNALISDNATAINAAENTILMAVEAEAAATKLAVAETVSDSLR